MGKEQSHLLIEFDVPVNGVGVEVASLRSVREDDTGYWPEAFIVSDTTNFSYCQTIADIAPTTAVLAKLRYLTVSVLWNTLRAMRILPLACFTTIVVCWTSIPVFRANNRFAENQIPNRRDR